VTSQSELAAIIARLESTRRKLLDERQSLLNKLETIDLSLQRLNERIQRYRREDTRSA
jgi:hypothetical protein